MLHNKQITIKPVEKILNDLYFENIDNKLKEINKTIKQNIRKIKKK